VAFSALVKRLADPGFFENFLFMPVTRDRSAGQRTLLYNWLNAGAKQVAAAAVAAPQPHLILSVSMRRL
jgi:hypothetical protein